MSSYGVSNAMILMVLIFIIFGIIGNGLCEISHLSGHVRATMMDTMTSFHESFISPEPVKDTDNMQEMIDLPIVTNRGRRAMSGEKTSSMYTEKFHHMPSSRSGTTNMTLVNTYQDDTISNGAEISDVRGFEGGTVVMLRGLI
jgi:hypothetical protein